MQDKARTYTDKELEKTERQISRMYKKHSALIKVRKEYASYMKMVEKKTRKAYLDYKAETDQDKRKELKKAYKDEVIRLTSESKEYRNIIKRFVEVMANVNQEALDIVNGKMNSIYSANYNQVAEDCKKVGIKVNGKQK